MRPLRLSLATLCVASLSACDLGSATTTGVQPHFSSLYADYFSNCAQCHAPGALGATSETEKTLDFSTQAKAYASLKSTASGLTGNQAGCNGVAFIQPDKPAMSLVVAALDSSTRKAFDLASNPSCDQNAISDMTIAKVGKAPSAEFLAALKTWIQNGAAND